jgi:cold shock CspA family protein
VQGQAEGQEEITAVSTGCLQAGPPGLMHHFGGTRGYQTRCPSTARGDVFLHIAVLEAAGYETVEPATKLSVRRQPFLAAAISRSTSFGVRYSRGASWAGVLSHLEELGAVCGG